MSAILDRPGIFKATVSDWALGTSKDSQIPVLSVNYAITAMLNGQEWDDWTDYGMTIRGFHYPFKKTGEPNEKTIEQLQAALGWDGASLKSLQDGAFANKEVQIVVKEEEYNGAKQIKVAWLNAGDYEPGLKQLDAKEVSTLASQWDAKLRAVSGGSPAPAKKGPPLKKG